MIELAWQHFTPQTRHSLDQPVSYEAVYYSLQSEFQMALRELEKKATPDHLARAIELAGGDR